MNFERFQPPIWRPLDWLGFHFWNENVNKACNLHGTKNHYKILSRTKFIIIVTKHLKGLCHSKVDLKLVMVKKLFW